MPGLRTSAASAAEGVTNRHTVSRGILSRTSGFLIEAGFTHSLTPARNCTFGCTYCYVPTMRVYGGLQSEDWQRWGQFTTFKSNAAELVARESRPGQVIYCSPLVDPYQPAEESEALMPSILESFIKHPPGVFVIQTRGPLILRDLEALKTLSKRTTLRVSYSITTNREEIRRVYEPLCAPIEQRFAAVRQLRAAGIETYATLAPLLPCDPEDLVLRAIRTSGRDVIGDPLHVRSVKPNGATTRDAAMRIASAHAHEDWFDPGFQEQIIGRMRAVACREGKTFRVGPKGFGLLARKAQGNHGNHR